MKFDEIKENSTYEKKQYPSVIGTGKLSKIIKKGTTEKGSYIVLGFNDVKLSGIMFGTKEEIDKQLEGIEIGTGIEIGLSGSQKGNVVKELRKFKGGEGENPSPSHDHSNEYREQKNLKGELAVHSVDTSHRQLSDEDLSLYLPAFKCQNCGETTLMFKQELRNEIERRVNMGVLPKRSYHVQEN